MSKGWLRSLCFQASNVVPVPRNCFLLHRCFLQALKQTGGTVKRRSLGEPTQPNLSVWRRLHCQMVERRNGGGHGVAFCRAADGWRSPEKRFESEENTCQTQRRLRLEAASPASRLTKDGESSSPIWLFQREKHPLKEKYKGPPPVSTSVSGPSWINCWGKMWRRQWESQHEANSATVTVPRSLRWRLPFRKVYSIFDWSNVGYLPFHWTSSLNVSQIKFLNFEYSIPRPRIPQFHISIEQTDAFVENHFATTQVAS